MDFRISVEDRGEVYKGINIEIPRAMYEARLQSAVMRASRQVKMKGFRPGRVPPTMVAKMYAPELKAEVMEELVQQALERAYADHKLSVVGVSQLEVQPERENSDLEVKAQVALYPEPEIKTFRGVSVSVDRPKVDETVVDKYVTSLLESRAKFEPREAEDAVVGKTDGVVADREVTAEGLDEPLKKENELFMLSGNRRDELPAEIVKALVGKKKGDKVEVTVKHEEGYKQIPQLAGKSASYTITIKGIYEVSIPELTPALMEEVAKSPDEAAFRAKLREDLEREAERRYETSKEEKLFETLIAENSFEVPQELVDHEIRNMLFEMGALKREDRRSYQVDVARFRERLGERAEFRVRAGIILGRVREQENVTVEESDREEWIDRTVAREKIDDREGFSRSMRAGERERWFEDVVLREKVVKMLLDASTIREEEKLLEV